MRLEKVELTNFRNYKHVEVAFQPGINIFLGANAQGKTSLMEAIHVLALARSHRTSHEKEMIMWEAQNARIIGQVKNRHSSFPLEIQLTSKGKKVKVNHIEQSRLSTFIGNLNVILFAPEDLYLIKGPPAGRRKFLDMEFGQMSPIYLKQSVQYQKLLKQRNAYLKMLLFKETKDILFLDVLTEQLVQIGAEILEKRLRFMNQLEEWSKQIHHEVSVQTEELTLKYLSRIELTAEMSVEEIYQALLIESQRVRDRELQQATTLFGPHRDDFNAYINGQDVQKYGSQGQQRTCVLSLKLAEIELMNQLVGEYPVLLLDDVLSELDDNRQTHLLKAIEAKVQTFLTTTSLDGVQREKIHQPTIFNIANGLIEEE